MAPKKSKTTKRDQKHGKNGKKGGLSGSSFFTWFMVIALLGVWTSVAVVWFDLVDYEDFIAKAKDFRYNLSEALQGKLGDYDADGDGDFDVDDAKVLLGFAQSPKMEKATKAPDLTGGITKTKTKEEGLKERFVSEKNSEDLDETDSTASEISDVDLEDVINAIKDSAQYDHDVNDIEDALDDHDTQDDAASEFSLEDALEPNVYEAVHTEPEVKEPEEEPAIEEQVVEEQEEEEPAAEEEVIDEVTEQVLAHEPAATEDDVEEETFTHHDEHEAEEHQEHEAEEHQEHEAEEHQEHEAEEHQEHEAEEHQEHEEEEHQEPEPVYEQEVEETETEFLNAPNTETEEPVDVEYEAEPLAAEEAGETPEPAAEEQDPQDEAKEPENQEEYETHEEPVLTGEEPSEDGTESYDEVNEYTQTELEEEEPAELPDAPEPEHTEEHPTETTKDIFTGGEEEVNEVQNEEPESPHEHVEVEQNEIPENPVVDDRPSERAQEQKTETLEGQQGEHAAKKKKPKLLNKFDKTIKAELDAAEKLRKKGKVEDALKAFELLVTKYPQSPRARYGKAQSEDDLAEKMRSNEILLRAIGTYEEVTGLPNVPSDLVKLALKRRANRQQFLGHMRGSILTLQKLVQLYPEDIALRNDLGVGYLLLGDNQKAKEVYEEVLSMDPNNGFAKVHYGFILKAENKIIESIPYLKEGLLSGEPGTDDGRFYFHLGDALQRAGDKEAYTWYEIGHKKGHFASVWQRSLYNVDGLRAQPWWTAKETGYSDLVRALEANWKTIRDEGLAVMDKSKGLFLPEDENLREKGDWSQYTLWQQGRQNEKSCKAAPKTCALLERFPESTGCRRGQIKYSVMHPGTHVWPHTGPTNCRLRMHLGLVIPNQGCRIRCANDTRSWEEGKVLIFDDSFEHEVWQDSDSYRLIFIVDVWHPELTQHQRRTLPAI